MAHVTSVLGCPAGQVSSAISPKGNVYQSANFVSDVLDPIPALREQIVSLLMDEMSVSIHARMACVIRAMFVRTDTVSQQQIDVIHVGVNAAEIRRSVLKTKGSAVSAI